MSETSYTALQGKVCDVTLKGTTGTNYCWCLASMPKELVLLGTSREAESPVCGGTYQEHFYFLVKGSEDVNVELKFEMICVSDPSLEPTKECTVEILIVPANSKEFAALDTCVQVENVDSEALLKYGYVCGEQGDQRNLKYGYPCGVQDGQQTLKYGYPCGIQDGQQTLKYGYPCGVQEGQQTLKYGYPCGVQESQRILKYGYPCGVQDGSNC